MEPESAPDTAWVAALAGRGREDACAALDEAQEQRRLFRHVQREHRAEGREGYGEIDAPYELHALVRLLRPSHVLEVGVSSGVSSAYLLNGLHCNAYGTLHSVDLPKRPTNPQSRHASWSLPPGRSPGWAVPFSLRRRWDLRLENERDMLPLLSQELPAVDLMVYDVPHEDSTTRKEFRRLDPLLRPGAVVIVDHGPEGGECAALRSWAARRESTSVGRAGSGLFGARLGRDSP